MKPFEMIEILILLSCFFFFILSFARCLLGILEKKSFQVHGRVAEIRFVSDGTDRELPYPRDAHTSIVTERNCFKITAPNSIYNKITKMCKIVLTGLSWNPCSSLSTSDYNIYKLFYIILIQSVVGFD